MTPLQRMMAHAFAGIVFALAGSAIGGFVGYTVSNVDDARLDEYLVHLPSVLTKTAGTVSGAMVGAAAGFPVGVAANVLWQSRLAERRLRDEKESR